MPSIDDFPPGKYDGILADPPRTFSTYSRKGKGRSAEAYYDTMSLEDIMALPVAQWAADDCALFLWTPRAVLEQSFEIIRSWGFHFKTVAFVWAKTIAEANQQPGLLGPVAPRFWLGMGYWTRSSCELCLLATRGQPRRSNADVRDLVLSPRRAHSQKPPEIYAAIERLLGPDQRFLELFPSVVAPPRANWTPWAPKDRSPQRRWKSDSYPDAPEVGA
jgi:N6-adenosine-specific RNA methylase IME4